MMVAAAALIALAGCKGKKKSAYEYGAVTRGDIENIVSSTGELQPVGTVTVGTQVSGTVERVLVDFNANVTRGQLLAVLDTANLAASVRDAEAGLARAEAQFEQADLNYKRQDELTKRDLASELDLENARVSRTAAQATLQTAQAALDRAKVNLGNAFIRSPISGRVIDRAVEPGVTVAASFSSPTLFTIAQDLSKVRILAQVDESDIGQIDSGMPVKFTVQAYPSKEFTGVTVQVRMQPETVSNVVNYTVVVDAANDEGLLLPGMTATVDFYVEQRKGVLVVPSAALKLQPTQEMVAEMRKSMPQRTGDSTRRRPGAHSDSTGRGEGNAGDFGRLWTVDEQGKISAVPVRVGATDGRNTEVTALRGELAESTRVITKATGTTVQFRGPPGGLGMPGFRGR
jgi:HlyD family secretion protein